MNLVKNVSRGYRVKDVSRGYREQEKVPVAMDMFLHGKGVELVTLNCTVHICCKM
jgi:hypothetical protein